MDPFPHLTSLTFSRSPLLPPPPPSVHSIYRAASFPRPPPPKRSSRGPINPGGGKGASSASEGRGVGKVDGKREDGGIKTCMHAKKGGEGAIRPGLKRGKEEASR